MTEAVLSLALLFLVTLAAPTFNFVLPIRPTWLLFLLPAQINWGIVAVVGIIGSTLGAVPLFWATTKLKDVKTVERWLSYRWVQWFVEKFKDKPFLLIIFLILTPVPDQLLGILGALERYPMKKFLLANAVGRVLFYVPLVLTGYFLRGDVNRLGESIIGWLGF